MRLTGGAPASRGNSAIAEDEYDEYESARYQRGADPVHPLVLFLGGLVGINCEQASDGNQGCDACGHVEDGSPGLAVQRGSQSSVSHIIPPTGRPVSTHPVSSTTTAPIVVPNTDPKIPMKRVSRRLGVNPVNRKRWLTDRRPCSESGKRC